MLFPFLSRERDPMVSQRFTPFPSLEPKVMTSCPCWEYTNLKESMKLQAHQNLLIPNRHIHLAPQGFLKGDTSLSKGLGKEPLFSHQFDFYVFPPLPSPPPALFQLVWPRDHIALHQTKTLECQSTNQDAKYQMKAETGIHCIYYSVLS